MKIYPLLIEPPLVDGEGWWSKGHHDPAAFLVALNNEARDGGLGWEYEEPVPFYDDRDLRNIQQSWWRKGQDCYSRGEEWAFNIYEYDGPGRGRFPVTVLWNSPWRVVKDT